MRCFKGGNSKATVSYHLRRAGANVGRGYVGRKAVCEVLGRSGVRVSELCDVRIEHVRLHDPQSAHFDIADAKTETGIREVQMSPALVAVVVAHIETLRRCGRRTDPKAYLVQNTRGGAYEPPASLTGSRTSCALAAKDSARHKRGSLLWMAQQHYLFRAYIDSNTKR